MRTRLAVLAVARVPRCRRLRRAVAAAALRPRVRFRRTTTAPVEQSATSDDAIGTGGAVDAALAYVASTDDLMAHSPVGRREIFRRLARADSAVGTARVVRAGGIAIWR